MVMTDSDSDERLRAELRQMLQDGNPDAMTASTETVARKLSYSIETLKDWRSRRSNKGPRFTKPEGTNGFYLIEDVIDWLLNGMHH